MEWRNFTRSGVFSLDSNSSRANIYYWTSGISSRSLDIHANIIDHWGYFPGSDVSDKYSENSLHFLRELILI